MKATLTRPEIEKLVDMSQLIRDIETGFVLYSQGRVEVPPVGFLRIDEAPGDVHIKYGHIPGDKYFVLKVASAFYSNPNIGLPTGNGIILLFNSQTGTIEFILQDEGWLTDIRTAAAGAVAAKHLANRQIDNIGIVGTGMQARLQLELLKDVVDCKQCLIWGRDPAKAKQTANALQRRHSIEKWGINLTVTENLNHLISHSDLIVTTTSTHEPLVHSEYVQRGTHITAVGADDHGKQELATNLLAKADIIVADSIAQCVDHGECRAGIADKSIKQSDILELGNVIQDPTIGRSNPDQITIADLTGVAVQDIQVAKMVVQAYLKQR